MKTKGFERALNDEIKVIEGPVTQKKRRPCRNDQSSAVAFVSYGGLFHDPKEKFAAAFKQALEEAAKIQPVKHVDPVSIEVKPLNKYQDQRFRAAKLARKYFNWPIMRKYALIARRHRLTPYQCGAIFNIAKKIEEIIKRQNESSAPSQEE